MVPAALELENFSVDKRERNGNNAANAGSEMFLVSFKLRCVNAKGVTDRDEWSVLTVFDVKDFDVGGRTVCTKCMTASDEKKVHFSAKR